MSSLSEAFDVPIPFKEFGLDLQIPKLDIDDHAAWCAELHAARKPVKLKAIPGNAPPAERARLQQLAEFAEPTLDDIADLLYTPKGARECVARALAKAGVADVAGTIKRIPTWRIQMLAIEASGLFRRQAAAEPAKAGESPLPAAGEASEGQATSTPAIGDSFASKSEATSDTQPSAA